MPAERPPPGRAGARRGAGADGRRPPPPELRGVAAACVWLQRHRLRGDADALGGRRARDRGLRRGAGAGLGAGRARRSRGRRRCGGDGWRSGAGGGGRLGGVERPRLAAVAVLGRGPRGHLVLSLRAVAVHAPGGHGAAGPERGDRPGPVRPGVLGHAHGGRRRATGRGLRRHLGQLARRRQRARPGRLGRCGLACLGRPPAGDRGGGLRDDALLELLRALGRAARPFAQALELARLREVQKGEHGQAEEGGDARRRRRTSRPGPRSRTRTRPWSEARDSRRRPGCQTDRPRERCSDRAPEGPAGSAASSPTLAASAAASPSSTSQLTWSNVSCSQAGSSARMLGAQDLLRGRRLRPLVRVEQLLVQLLARAAARSTSIAMSRSGSSPESRIMSRARSMIFTGSPISSTKTSPPCTSEPARITSWTASGIVMK